MSGDAGTGDAVSGDAVSGDAGTGDAAEPTPEERRALFRVVRGTPTDEELAALTVVLAATPPPEARPRAPRSAWTERGPLMRTPLRRRPGPDTWRMMSWGH